MFYNRVSLVGVLKHPPMPYRLSETDALMFSIDVETDIASGEGWKTQLENLVVKIEAPALVAICESEQFKKGEEVVIRGTLKNRTSIDSDTETRLEIIGTWICRYDNPTLRKNIHEH